MRTRLALFTGTAVAVVCLLFSAVLMLAIHRLTMQSLVREARVAGEFVASAVVRGEVSNPLPAVSDDLVRPVQVVNAQGKVVAASGELQGRPPMARFLPQAPKTHADGVVCDDMFGHNRCAVVVARQVPRAGGDWTVYSAAPALPFYVYPAVLALLGGGTIIATAAVSRGVYGSVHCSLRPVRAIRAELDEIHSTDLGRRVPLPEARDELRELALSVNYTLDRLEEALEQQRRFTSDASHELRSPITAIRVQMEAALLAPQDVDVGGLAREVLASINRLQRIASDLQTLTRLDAGAPGVREPVDVAEIVATELKGRHHTRKIVQFMEPGVIVRGDRAQLGRLVANLLDNAERHASSTVTVRVRSVPVDPGSADRFARGAAWVEILDDGAGISAQDREFVFERFARLDTARSRGAGGAGLGLPIARLIAESHGGTLTAADQAGGACFVLCLPLTASPSGLSVNGRQPALAARRQSR
ncbi:HAMP domain-containing protein [Microbispora sp. RL4-1S]|uniref:histidine kinase n=1 Tax=Microbispora oryzae TaxID=2806554 RepID=A0A940WJ72_9ACTN|nr:ATP-binding protein [Microbispora oryzae]MBP2706610.1 HAMP domain-containing protein [Microbispora oryzae]